MRSFILCKEDGYYNLLIECPISNMIAYDTGYHKSNYPLRIVKNNYGDIIVASPCSTIYTQIIMANTNLLSKNEHIDYDYLKDYYFPKICDIINNNNAVVPDQKVAIIVITKEQAYYFSVEKGVIEEDLIASFNSIKGSYKAVLQLNKYKGEDLLVEAFQLCRKTRDILSFPAVFVSTKDYKVKFIKGEII